jgi:methionyl-tRNA formyltransferase
MNYLIAAHHSWNKKNFDALRERTDLGNFFFISNKEDLSLKFLEDINPRYIFFPHWNYIVPEEILNSYECVCFHMTDLPFGRGGSPLQNLIIRGMKKTKISALRMTEVLDGGPIYIKKDLSLSGKAGNIYKRASKIIFNLIIYLVKNNTIPQPQEGEIVSFSRRKPSDSAINDVQGIDNLFNFIRMLDAPNYPHAFLENDNFKFHFTNVKYNSDNELQAKVIIKKKN